MPSEPTDAQGAGMLSQPQPRQPKNWRLVLQQIIDCRDERDKVLMIAQDALNMSQPDPQDTELRERLTEALRSIAFVECERDPQTGDPVPSPRQIYDTELRDCLALLLPIVQQELARAQPTERRPGESWSCFVCHEPTDALFALCESHKHLVRAQG